ncbi:S1C family serine protease [Clavibacter tessellarius]|uniref:S1C family serine protease n=1 Tax=Clavibacter tessellarius TaxID=31965 RepID=UPI00324F3656
MGRPERPRRRRPRRPDGRLRHRVAVRRPRRPRRIALARSRHRRVRPARARGRRGPPGPAEAHGPRPPHGPHRRRIRPRPPPRLRQRHRGRLHGRPRAPLLRGGRVARPGPRLLRPRAGPRPGHGRHRAGLRQRVRHAARLGIRHRHLGDLPEASAEQIAGVVTVDSALTYENAAGAGTGIILSSDGTILTNNHVVSGATSIRVTVESTGKAYVGKVVGTDATNDVAVLKLEGASGLTPAKIDTDGVQVGEAVTGVGNAGGTGTLTAASGSVTALGQSVTTQSEGTAAGETLTDLIQTDAPIVSGDSGGPSRTRTARSSASTRPPRADPPTSPASPSRSTARCPSRSRSRAASSPAP